MNKENCALKLVDEITLYYDARSKKHKKKKSILGLFQASVAGDLWFWGGILRSVGWYLLTDVSGQSNPLEDDNNRL